MPTLRKGPRATRLPCACFTLCMRTREARGKAGAGAGLQRIAGTPAPPGAAAQPPCIYAIRPSCFCMEFAWTFAWVLQPLRGLVRQCVRRGAACHGGVDFRGLCARSRARIDERDSNLRATYAANSALLDLSFAPQV